MSMLPLLVPSLSADELTVSTDRMSLVLPNNTPYQTWCCMLSFQDLYNALIVLLSCDHVSAFSLPQLGDWRRLPARP